MKPSLEFGARDLADTVVADLAAGVDEVVIRAAPGTGRSLVLEFIRESLEGTGTIAVIAAPPSRSIDTASIALLDIAVGLDQAGVGDRLLSSWKQPAAWEERLSNVRDLLKEAASNRAVLLIEDPSRWPLPEARELAGRLEDVDQLLLTDNDCRKVVVGSDRGLLRPTIRPLPNVDTLANPVMWGLLEDPAATLAAACPQLASRPPAEVGFLVALAALTSVDELTSWWTPDLTVDLVADHLVAVVVDAPSYRPLWAAWMAGAVPRRPMSALRSLSYIERLTSPELREIFERCLLTNRGERVVREARAAAWRARRDDLADRIRRETAQDVHRINISLMNSALDDDDPKALTYAAEAGHMAGYLGDLDTLLTVPLPFADQLNAVGMAGVERSDWEFAAATFDLALEIDSADPVATHYRGYALDNEAREPKRVEASYQRALDLDRSHATWHARLVSFYVVQARMEDARRRWGASLADLLADDGEGAPELYSRLHLPVAANSLRRAEIGFACEVLDDVPRWARREVLGYQEERHRLTVLEAGSTTGSFVPADRLSGEWWRSGPELLAERHPDGRPLERWVAAGVEFLEPAGVTLAVAVVRAGQPPETGTTRLSWEQLNEFADDISRARSLEVGDFLEIGYYSHGAELPQDPMIRILPRRSWEAGLETPMDPARYIRRMGW